ncbi:MAG TPA: hypothetical protein VLA79_21540 [Polyangia bacterium]|nr:hypothetical protein [Polyangia bacterium]
MPGDRVTVVEVEPRRTAVIAATIEWEEFAGRWRPMLDEVYTFVRQCPEFAVAIEGTPGPHWTNVMLYRGEAPNVEVGVLWEVYGHPDASGNFATEVFHLLA